MGYNQEPFNDEATLGERIGEAVQEITAECLVHNMLSIDANFALKMMASIFSRF